MQPLLLWAIILLATIGNIAPFLLSLKHTPPGWVFLGTMHHPGDYFYYLSQFAQGAHRWLTSIDLYTSEPVAPSFVGWTNVLAGRIFHTIGVPPAWAYLVCVIAGTILLLLAAYTFAKSILGSQRGATIALFLFALFHAFPILRNGQPSYADYWNNIAVPSVRMGAVPHQLLIGITSMLCVLFLFGSATTGLAISGFVLASLQPVLWLLITVTAAVCRKWKGALTLALSGALPAIYLSRLFESQPFIQLKQWEALQQTPLTLWEFLLSMGPISLLALLFLPVFLAADKHRRLYIAIFPFLSALLFLSPLPQQWGLSHVRFMSALTVLCLSIIAASGIMSLKRLGMFLLILLTVYLLPNHLKTITINTNKDTTNAYYYLPKAEYDLLIHAQEVSSPEDVFFVAWPFNVVFPGISGRRSFHGHPLLTINAQQKEAIAAGGPTKELLEQYGISYVVSYETDAPFLSPIATGGALIIYKVSL